MFEDADLEDCSHVATSQGMPAATGSWKRQGMDPTLQSPEEVQPFWHLDFGPVKLILSIWLPEL